jgi:hypothetical protein
MNSDRERKVGMCSLIQMCLVRDCRKQPIAPSENPAGRMPAPPRACRRPLASPQVLQMISLPARTIEAVANARPK